MAIWRNSVNLDILNEGSETHMMGHLGIVISEIGEDYICATMPVDKRTKQPYGILHGGASVVLAETIGSIASALCIDFPAKKCVGLSINANHLKPVTEGMVKATARPYHLGRTTHVWEIKLENEAGKLVCICRLTMAIV